MRFKNLYPNLYSRDSNYFNYLDVETKALSMLNSIQRVLDWQKSSHGITGFEEKTTPIGKEWTLTDNKGKREC